ncbi:MAG: BamA/TamA family outer membrane protein [candidate division Zixibacteria bacterium]|nr:BamA/TamA family outer membrane protein [Gammaproteobacteria bacterium]NIX58739.1 BamA/TamA family outer membrane protein [candidate division Zixibacteria bacterium]
MAFLNLFIQTGGRLKLNEIGLNGIDSLPEAIRSQITEESESYTGSYYTEAVINGLFHDIINILENFGYPLASATTGEFEFREDAQEDNWLLDLSVNVQPGDSVRIAYLRFPKQKNNMSQYLQRVLRFQPGQLYREREVSKYAQILRRQEVIKQADEPVLSMDNNNEYFLSINFEEAPSTNLDGIVGYIPPPATQTDESGYFTGLINIGIRNLFGGGRKFTVFWQKQDRFSDEFRIAYREPFIFGLPFHSQFGLYRLVRDTTFIEWRYNVNFELPINESLSAFLDFSTRSVVPDSLASRQLRLPQTQSFNTETGIKWDTRDALLNPNHGINLEIAFSLGSQRNQGPQYLIEEDSLQKTITLRKIRADFSTFLPVFSQQVLANHLHLEFLENSGDMLRITDQVWFGGATSVRGFREAQFFAKRVVWLNSEYRFLLGPQSRIFLFTDNAYFTRTFPDEFDKWLTSYGMGVRFSAPLGIIQVDFGMEKGSPFQEAKVHFRVINEF